MTSVRGTAETVFRILPYPKQSINSISTLDLPQVFMSNSLEAVSANDEMNAELPLWFDNYLDGIPGIGDKLEAQACLGQAQTMGNHLAHGESARPN